MLQTRLKLLENKIEGVEADYGYGKIFAMHLQSNETPVCPVGTFKLWIGYSLVKAFVSLPLSHRLALPCRIVIPYFAISLVSLRKVGHDIV